MGQFDEELWVVADAAEDTVNVTVIKKHHASDIGLDSRWKYIKKIKIQSTRYSYTKSIVLCLKKQN